MKTQGTILNVKSKDYDFQGKKGTSLRAAVLVGDAVFSVKVEESLFEKVRSLVNAVGTLEFTISAFSMKPSLTLVSFEKSK